MRELAEVRQNWDLFAKSDPLWAIYSRPDKKGNRWDLEEFMASGVREIEGVLASLTALGRPVGRGHALDFGCGVGRLSQALAQHFDRVVGVDISAVMVNKARELNRHGDRCRYLHNDNSDLRALGDQRFDLIYSNITLQHVPPGLVGGYLFEFIRLLRPDGVLVFQLPSGPARSTRVGWQTAVRSAVPPAAKRLYRRLRHRSRLLVSAPVMLMNASPRERVTALIKAAGGELLEVRPDGSAGPDWVSHMYVVGKGVPVGHAE